MSDLVTESFIDGAAVSSAETYPNIDPSTGAALGDVARAGAKEVDRAVAAARCASREWRSTTPEQRHIEQGECPWVPTRSRTSTSSSWGPA